jgi:hypothetical protein
VRVRESRLTEAAPEIPAKGSTDSLAVSALTFADRQAAIAVAFEAGMHYQAGLDVEDRARALLHSWATESRNMATKYAARVGPAWSAMIQECSQVDD